jgi:hypothetical protein
VRALPDVGGATQASDTHTRTKCVCEHSVSHLRTPIRASASLLRSWLHWCMRGVARSVDHACVHRCRSSISCEIAWCSNRLSSSLPRSAATTTLESTHHHNPRLSNVEQPLANPCYNITFNSNSTDWCCSSRTCAHTHINKQSPQPHTADAHIHHLLHAHAHARTHLDNHRASCHGARCFPLSALTTCG